ncbi:MAG: protease modulator HflC [Caulobacterales bacterium]|nr:protease modulator HflC [Caulobacterales bacterium]
MARLFAAAVLIVALAGSFVGLNMVFTVSEVQQALVLRLGNPVAEHNEWGTDEPGLKFKRPFTDSVVYLDKRNLGLNSPADQITGADNQRLVVDTFARWRVSEPLRFYQRLNNITQAEQRLAQILNTSVREVLGTVNTTDIISGQRAELMARIEDRFTEAVTTADLGVIVVDVKIRRVELPEENRDRVFSRMIAERNQEAERIRAEGREQAARIRADADRQARIIQAEANEESQRIRGDGDGQRNKIYADAYNLDPEFFAFYRSMLAYEQALEEGTTMLLSPDSDFFRYFGDQSGAGGGGR